MHVCALDSSDGATEQIAVIDMTPEKPKVHYNASLLSDRFPQSLTTEVLTLGLGVQAAGEITDYFTAMLCR